MILGLLKGKAQPWPIWWCAPNEKIGQPVAVPVRRHRKKRICIRVSDRYRPTWIAPAFYWFRLASHKSEKEITRWYWHPTCAPSHRRYWLIAPPHLDFHAKRLRFKNRREKREFTIDHGSSRRIRWVLRHLVNSQCFDRHPESDILALSRRLSSSRRNIPELERLGSWWIWRVKSSHDQLELGTFGSENWTLHVHVMMIYVHFPCQIWFKFNSPLGYCTLGTRRRHKSDSESLFFFHFVIDIIEGRERPLHRDGSFVLELVTQNARWF